MDIRNRDILNGTCVIVFNEQGQILLGKRINCYRAGTYGLPGGRLEINESIIDSINRELTEETGLISNKINFLGTIRESCDGYDFIHFVYSCNNFSGQPKNLEPNFCAGWEWRNLDTLPDLMPSHRLALSLIDNKEKLIDTKSL